VDVVDEDSGRRLLLLVRGGAPFLGRPGRLVSAKMRSGGTGGGASMKRQSDSVGTLISAPMRRPSSITV
jgi:hypothetical protein